MVAEIWARCRYRATSANKLNEAQAEAVEIQAWLDHARMAGYIDQETYISHDETWQRIGGKLYRMIEQADRFCSPRPHA